MWRDMARYGAIRREIERYRAIWGDLELRVEPLVCTAEPQVLSQDGASSSRGFFACGGRAGHEQEAQEAEAEVKATDGEYQLKASYLRLGRLPDLP